jgi:phenylalanyl-tRNA synthetase alpha subunit
MAKTKINPQALRKIIQTTDEVIPTKKEIPPDGKPPMAEETNNENEKAIHEQALNQLKAQKEAWAKKRIKEVEDEVRLLAQKRQEEMRKRREEMTSQQQQQETEAKKVHVSQPPEVSHKPKRGLPFWGRRIKSAQQQAQPETAGRRAGG